MLGKLRKMLTVLVAASSLALAIVEVPRADDHLITSLPGFEGDLLVKHYSGLEELDGAGSFTDSVQMHYWLAESAGKPATDPLIVWLQGGPGGSSLNGAFTEMGPLSLDGRSLATDAFNRTGIPTPLLNPYSWNQFANFVSVEAPAGVGFSVCAKGAKASCAEWHDTKNTAYLFAFFQQFYRRFPALLKVPLWIAGESYAGIVVTLLAEAIVLSNAALSAVNARDALDPYPHTYPWLKHDISPSPATPPLSAAGGRPPLPPPRSAGARSPPSSPPAAARILLGGVLHGNGAVGHHCGGPPEWWPDGNMAINTNDLPGDARHHGERAQPV